MDRFGLMFVLTIAIVVALTAFTMVSATHGAIGCRIQTLEGVYTVKCASSSELLTPYGDIVL